MQLPVGHQRRCKMDYCNIYQLSPHIFLLILHLSRFLLYISNIKVSSIYQTSSLYAVKTKPTQHSVRGLRGLGLTSNILACRSAQPLDENVKEKLSQFCHVQAANIVRLYDVPNIWHIPLLLRDQKAHEAILKGLDLLGVAGEPMLEDWIAMTKVSDMLHDPVRIAMVGKYTGLSDAYVSVLKALLHASVDWRRKLVVDWVAATDLEETTAKEAPTAYQAAWKLLRIPISTLMPGQCPHSSTGRYVY